MKVSKRLRNYFLISLLFWQLLTIVLSQPIFSQEKAGLDYYISPSGSDLNLGTSQNQAWQTISKINSVTFKAGDRILFEGGASFSGNLSFNASDKGTSTAPIIITSYGTGAATINAGTGSGISVYNAGGYQISNLKIIGNGASSNSGSGVSFYMDLANNTKLEYIKLDNLEVSGFGKDGIAIGAWNNQSGYRNVSITNVLTHDNAKAGLGTYAQVANTHENVYVGYLQAYNNFGIARQWNPSGNGIVLGGVNGGTVEYSVAHDNGKNDNNGPGPVGIWAYDSNKITIQHNESYNNRTGGSVDGDGFDLDQNVSNSVMQYNYAHGNDGAGYLLCQEPDNQNFTGNEVRYNISENDGRKNSYGGIHLYGRIRNTQIYNNTVFIPPAITGSPSGIRIGNSGVPNLDVSGIHIRNNIVQTTGGASLVNVAATQIDGARDLLFQGNNYYSSGQAFKINWGNTVYDSLTNWRTGTNQEKLLSQNVGSSVDPQLLNPGGGGRIGNPKQLNSLNAYQLNPNSPLIDTGLDLNKLFNINSGKQDFYGTLVPKNGGYDIGAYEKQ